MHWVYYLDHSLNHQNILTTYIIYVSSSSINYSKTVILFYFLFTMVWYWEFSGKQLLLGKHYFSIFHWNVWRGLKFLCAVEEGPESLCTIDIVCYEVFSDVHTFGNYNYTCESHSSSMWIYFIFIYVQCTFCSSR